MRVFERSGHYPFVEEPGRFAGVVAAFLSSAARVTGPVCSGTFASTTAGHLVRALP